jgi:hypothetical protein
MRTPAARSTRRFARLAIAATVIVAGLQAPGRAEEAAAKRSAAQLEQLLAPIALYPDPLLAQMLMAATYPLEVAEAARWSQANPAVAGEALKEAVQKEAWDASVRGLTALPLILQMMSDKREWTQALGDAFLARPQAVLDAIQRLRVRAEVAGNLQSTPQQKVARVAAPPEPGSTAPPGTVYTIEPATADEYSVPIYHTRTAFGAWPHAEHPPFSWSPPGHVGSSSGLAFASSVAVGGAIWGLVDWWQHRVNINVGRFNRFNDSKITRRVWVHDPAHRGGVPYPAGFVAARVGDPGKAAAREGDERSAESDKPEAKPKGARASRNVRSVRHAGRRHGRRR